MASEVELRKWLNRPGDFLTNLRFGIKAWSSIEFNLITKHEIITEEFCSNLPKFRKQHKHNFGPYFDAWPSTINEFLALNCSPGAISSTIKSTVVKTLILEAQKLKRSPHPSVLQGMLLVLHNSAMQNFYKSNSDAYCEFIASILMYINALSSGHADVITIGYDVERILDAIKIFVQQTPHLDLFQKAFLRSILVPLSELVITLHVQQIIDYTGRFVEILRELYFGDKTSDGLKNWFITPTPTGMYTELFDAPIHTFLLIFETILQAYRHDVCLRSAFISWLFDNYFGRDGTRFQDVRQMLDALSYVMCVMRKHDVHLNFDVGKQKASVFIGKHLETIFDDWHETAFGETINLVIATLTANPMILEHALVKISVKCMLMPKNDDTTMQRFTQMMQLVIDVYRRLSRAQKFVTNLIRSVFDELAAVKLSRKLKRKSMVSSTLASRKKMKLNGGELNGGDGLEHDQGADDIPSATSYLNMLLNNVQLPTETKSDGAVLTTIDETLEQYPCIEFAWPIAVGHTFGNFISSLMSKPSLVVCKTLIFTLNDYVGLLKEGRNDENTLFLIEFASALMCQYFSGTRLAEHTEKQSDAIESNRRLTHDVLKEFGMAILNQEHNIRTMNAFLKTCFHTSHFDLLCWYYCPDAMQSDMSRVAIAKLADNVHPYLGTQEWTLIEQRITNFGRDECRANINRLYLQKIKASLLLGQVKKHKISMHLLSPTLTDLTQITMLLTDETIGQWFLEILTAAEMRAVCELLVADGKSPPTKILNYFAENRQALETFALAVFKKCCQITDIFETKVILEKNTINKSMLKKIVARVRENSYSDDGGGMKQLSDDDCAAVAEMLRALSQLPIGFIDVDVKNVLFMMAAMIYYDRKLEPHDCGDVRKLCFELTKELLHFGDIPTVFNVKLLTIIDLKAIFGLDDTEVYHLLFGKIIKHPNDSNIKMLATFLEDFEKNPNDETLTISDILLEYLSKERKYRQLYSQCRETILTYIKSFFQNNQATVSDERNAFICVTLSGFTTVISAVLSARTGSSEPIDSALIEIFHFYFGQLFHFNDIAAIKLLNIAINYKDLLNTTAEQINAVIQWYWNVYIIDNTGGNNIDDRIELFLKILLNYKSNDEVFALFCKIIDSGNVNGSFKPHTFKHFATIAKLQLSKAKAHMFVESFKQFFSLVTLTKNLDASLAEQYDPQLLQCQRVIVDNVQIPVTIQFIDDTLALMAEINLKKFKITCSAGNEANRFLSLHTNAADLCHSLVHTRSVFIVDRMPQFVGIFRDLVQSICWYRNERAREENLSNSEITMLAEQSHKLENIIKALIKHAKDVKRVAPYLLVFVINLYTSNERPATLYPKIKTYIDNICYDLISICDHRVEGFIMRCCSESSKQLYEKLVKEYNKYHKFRGKV